MGNMSYCRFENTARDLKDCVDALENGETQELSNREIEGLEDLLRSCESIFQMKEDIESIIESWEESDVLPF